MKIKYTTQSVWKSFTDTMKLPPCESSHSENVASTRRVWN